MRLFSAVSFAGGDDAGQRPLRQLMEPVGTDKVDAPIPSNIGFAGVWGVETVGANLEALTDYRQRNASYAIAAFQEYIGLADHLERSARAGGLVGAWSRWRSSVARFG